jgi:signal transduction histidine kinase
MARRTGGLKALEDAVGEAIEHLEEGISNLRALVTDLRPAALDELGLEAAIAALCERASRHGLQVDRSLDLAFEQGREQTRHTPELESTIYRIIQEALTNATKHGHATRAVIEARENAGSIELSVRDDGDGFDPATSTAGFGLLGMRERVQLLHGTIHVSSSPGNGATVAASFPVQRRPAKAIATDSRPIHAPGAA